MGNGRQARLINRCASSCSLLARLGRSARLARTTITSTPRSVNGVEVRSISNLLVDQGGLLPVRAVSGLDWDWDWTGTGLGLDWRSFDLLVLNKLWLWFLAQYLSV